MSAIILYADKIVKEKSSENKKVYIFLQSIERVGNLSRNRKASRYDPPWAKITVWITVKTLRRSSSSQRIQRSCQDCHSIGVSAIDAPSTAVRCLRPATIETFPLIIASDITSSLGRRIAIV
jgi:hypothetical protein